MLGFSFFFLLEATFIQAGLPAWRTGQKVGANSCLHACWVPYGKAFPEENNNSGYQRASGYRLVKEEEEEKRRLRTCSPAQQVEPSLPLAWPMTQWRWTKTSHLAGKNQRSQLNTETKGSKTQEKKDHWGGWHSSARHGLNTARSLWLEKPPRARSTGQEIKGPGGTDVVFNLDFQLRIQSLREKTECERKKENFDRGNHTV